MFVTNAWYRGSPDGSGYYRAALPARELMKHGHQTWHTGKIAVAKDGSLHGPSMHNPDPAHTFRDPDVVVIQRWMDMDLPDVIRRARACGQVIVQDIDDWYLGLDTRNRAFLGTHPKVSPEANRNHLMRSFAASDALWVSTPFLADGYRRYQDNVRVLRNPIDLDRWDALYADRTHRGHKPAVGWVGSTRWRSGDLETLKGVVAPFLEQHDLPFIHAGAVTDLDTGDQEEGQVCEALGIDIERLWTYGSMGIRSYPSLLQRMDIGLVPLNDMPFNEAKSCLKEMEYAAARVPFVAGPTAEYRRLADELGCGVSVKNRARFWRRELERLRDPYERAADAARNRAAITKQAIYWRWTDWQEALEDLPVQTSLTTRGVPLHTPA
jgi:hypothetical protein